MENILCNIWGYITTAAIALGAAWLGSRLTFYFNQKKEKDQCRRVAAAIMKAFLAEIRTGLAKFESACKTGQNAQLPNKAWTTYEDKLSIPIIDVCLQCRENTCKGGKNNVNVEAEFSVGDFLQHLKNYYEYIVLHAQQCSQLNSSQRDDLFKSASKVEHLIAHLVRELGK